MRSGLAQEQAKSGVLFRGVRVSTAELEESSGCGFGGVFNAGDHRIGIELLESRIDLARERLNTVDRVVVFEEACLAHDVVIASAKKPEAQAAMVKTTRIPPRTDTADASRNRGDSHSNRATRR
jgi:hypothetical protein